MDKAKLRTESRLKRRKSIRKKIFGRDNCPRLSVFRSSRHIYAQIIDDQKGVTLAAASSLSPEIKDKTSDISGKKAMAKEVGSLIAQKATANGVTNVAFDRGGYLYHGRVKALAEAARESGLKF
jgi:large subunit ribosomal protein L18